MRARANEVRRASFAGTPFALPRGVLFEMARGAISRVASGRGDEVYGRACGCEIRGENEGGRVVFGVACESRARWWGVGTRDCGVWVWMSVGRG